MTIKWILAAAPALLLSATVMAKLPPLSDEAKAKAAETAAKNAHTDKVGAYKLCKAQDKVAAQYLATKGKGASAPVSTPACTDPGPFAYKPPLEASGAHSPAKTATTPPSTPTPHAEQQPAKK